MAKVSCNLGMFIFLFFCPFVLSAQSYKPAQSVQVIEHFIVVPEGGTLERALALTQEWTEHVLRKNKNFESIQLLLSDTAMDTVSLMVLYKYKAQLTEDTNEINQRLIQAHWPEAGSFDRFIKELHTYINPKLNKRTVFKELVLK